MIFDVHRLDDTSSTNDEVMRMAEEGAPEGTVVIARRQTSGRGRLRRHWESPEGSGLYLSILLRPQICASDLWHVGFIASLATAESIRRAFSLDARIKWPNDVLIGGRKACGILVESTLAGVPSRPVVAGIGINVNTPSFPAELAEKATSLLLQSGVRQDVSLAESALLDSVGEWYSRYLEEGFSPVIEAWRSLDCTCGRRVQVLSGGSIVEGRAAEVDPCGNLVVEQDDLQRTVVSAGEVILGQSI